MTSRPSTAAPILAVLAVVLVTLGAYVGGYLWLGDAIILSAHVEREFSHRWQCAVFQPAAWLEARLRQDTVRLTCPADDSWHQLQHHLGPTSVP
jgi:hypothetical protein